MHACRNKASTKAAEDGATDRADATAVTFSSDDDATPTGNGEDPQGEGHWSV